MKIIAFFILPIIFSQTLLPTAITQNKNDNKLLILKGGSTDISGRVDTPGFDSNTWVAYYAGKPMPVT